MVLSRRSIVILLLCSIIFSQEDAPNTVLHEILTTDNVEYLGEITSENDSTLTLKAPSGITVTIPLSSIVSRTVFEGDVKEGKVWRPDPNKSMYLFAPSAFPIESGNSYCRDFCLFFPSYNFGVGDVISAQVGAFWFPGMPLENTPLIASGKYSFINFKKIKMAAGIMYLSFPGFDEGERFGTGFTFVTGTLGDRFSHLSGSLGWGFVQTEGNWKFMERPILVVAGNRRTTNTTALVAEIWLPPELDLEMVPIMASVRFFGKKISVDIGGLWTTNMEGLLPMPLINFTYQTNHQKLK
ncbi:MAG: hypothetical protein H8E14_11535 [Candidatus Marinimicrobia bacterium]|nr:hypothetical protein [Candidatus Neomarinimicrobiota bacterium]